MPRFDVHRLKNPRVPLALNVQADLLSGLQTRVVVPLVPLEAAKKEAIEHLKPVLTIHNTRYLLMTTDIATLPLTELGPVVTNLKEHHHVITNALDFLFQGF